MTAQPSLSLESRLGQEVWTAPALLERRATLSDAEPALWSLTADGSWRSTRWSEYRDAVARIARSLCELGLAPGDRVGIMAPSSRHWDFLQMGILTARGVVVGLDAHDRTENLNAVARRCELTGLLIADPAGLNRFAAEVRDPLRFVVSFQPTDAHGVTDLNDLLRDRGDAEPAWSAAQPDDPATLIFTSGTTGAPRGIQYTHRQLVLAAAAILEMFPDIDADSRLACWLPLSNLFQRMINLCAIGCGAQTYYVEDPRAIMQQVGAIQPHLFIGVPRFYEKLHAGLMAKIGEAPRWQQRLVAWALHGGDRYARAVRAGRVPDSVTRAWQVLADRLVLRRLRGILGPNLRFLVSGSAPMPHGLLEQFHAMGLLILEAYGLSENVIPVAMNRPDAYRFGTVGRALRGNEVRLAADGELWVRGPGVFSGYHGEDPENARFDAEGYLASGDYATRDAEGFITLTGRKSEIFKTSTGRRIAPAVIEGVLRQAHYVEHAAVFGAGRVGRANPGDVMRCPAPGSCAGAGRVGGLSAPGGGGGNNSGIQY